MTSFNPYHSDRLTCVQGHAPTLQAGAVAIYSHQADGVHTAAVQVSDAAGRCVGGTRCAVPAFPHSNSNIELSPTACMP